MFKPYGRWGNFVNREAYGAITNSFLKMGIFDNTIGKYIFVHPTFLYESIIDFSIFIFLMIKRKKTNEKGSLFYWYMFLYGIGRAFVEGLRSDSLYLYNFRVSQVLALIFAAFFGILILNFFSLSKTGFVQFLEELMINSYLCIYYSEAQNKFNFIEDSSNSHGENKKKNEYYHPF